MKYTGLTLLSVLGACLTSFASAIDVSAAARAMSTIPSLSKDAFIDTLHRQASAHLDTLRRQSSNEEKMQCFTDLVNTLSDQYYENEGYEYSPLYVMAQLFQEPTFFQESCVPDEDGSGLKCDVYDADFHTEAAEYCEGETHAIDFVIDLGFPVAISGLPLCLGNTCERADAFFFFNSIIFQQIPGDFNDDLSQTDDLSPNDDGAGVAGSLRYTGTTGMQCLEDTLSNYGLGLLFNGTLFESGIPFEVLDVDEDKPLYLYNPGELLSDAEILENEDICEITFVGQSPVMTCNLSDYDFGDMKSICHDEGGKYIENDLSFEIDSAQIKLLNFPICISNTCSSDKEGIAYLDYLLELAFGSDIHFQPSSVETCFEDATDRFLWKMKDGVAIEKPCSFLKIRGDVDKERKCGKKWSPEGYDVAGDACPATCCKCQEGKKSLFVKKGLMVDGNMQYSAKTCGWLAKQSDEKIAFYCAKNIFSEAGQIGPAYSACPDTCGACSNF